MGKIDQLFTSASCEHNTPRMIIDAIRDVFGGCITLDPASNEEAQAYIHADRYWTLDKECAPHAISIFDQLWLGNVWLNPPFSVPTRTGSVSRHRVINKWVQKWVDSVETCASTNAALLVPARTDTAWFQPLWAYPMCFIRGRLKFGDATNGATFPTVIVYAGLDEDRFYTRFSTFGHVGTVRRDHERQPTWIRA